MKYIHLLFLLSSFTACRVDQMPNTRTLSGDYSDGHAGLQLRLYPDSTFYIESGPYDEWPASWMGKWQLATENRIILNFDTSRITIIDYITAGSGSYFFQYKWTAQFIGADAIKIQREESPIASLLKKGKIQTRKSDDEIYYLTHY